MLLKLRYYGDPVLRKKAEKITEITPEIKKLAEDLIETMYEEKGVGLAAPQVGVSKRIIAVDAAKVRGNAFVIINPQISDSKGSIVMEEGCLSFPEIYGKIERAEEVTVTGLNIEGQKFSLSFKDLEARAFLHEIDHLDGTLFIDRMSATHKIVIKSKLKKLMKATKESLGIK